MLFILLALSFLFSIDTDQDGYSDELEALVGTDPENKEDRYYYGSWPYSHNKEKYKAVDMPVSCPSNISCPCELDSDCVNENCQRAIKGGSYCTPKPGDSFPRFIAVDQYGESVDIYDFSMQGKLVVVEFGAAWCSPCGDLSSWLSTGDKRIENNPWWKDQYHSIKRMIDDKEIFFITILFQDQLREPAGYQAMHDWHEKYPNSLIPILSDEYADIHQWLKPTGYPCVNILNEDMQLLHYSTRGLTDAFDMLSGLKLIPNLD